MAQAGMHALVGIATRSVAPKRDWLLLGIVLGNLFPDLDNYAVAVATVAKMDTHGLHRTFTHSLLGMLSAVLIFYIIASIRRQPRWTNLGIGLGLGIGMHILLDLLLWFNGVELLWPFGGWVNFWADAAPPVWFMQLMDPAEFLFFALYFVWLGKAAQDQHTDLPFLKTLRWWTLAMVALSILFLPLVLATNSTYYTVYGLAYLVSLTVAFVITVRMRHTLEFQQIRPNRRPGLSQAT